jgi:preprotein translocase subunit SecE
MTEQQPEPKKRTGAVKKVAPEADKQKEESSIARYIRETRGEMSKVTWPDRSEAQRLTAIVLAFTAVFAIFLGLLDFLWSQGLQSLIQFLVR